MPKLTKTIIDALKPDPARDVFLWCSELRGFGVRMKPSGRASFVIQYKTGVGATRRMVVSQVGAMTPTEARAIARARLAEAAQGLDPSADRKSKRSAMTVAELCAAYMEAARAGNVTTRARRPKRASTIEIDAGRIARHIVPLLGTRPAAEVTRADVQKMIDAIAAGKTAATIQTKTGGTIRVTGGPGTAARTVELLGGIFAWGERRGYVECVNPVRGTERQRSQAKDSVLSRKELAALGKAIDDMAAGGSPQSAAALRLICLTGLRLQEACGLRWSAIDFDASCLRLEASKTGKSMRPIGRAAIERLKTLPRLHDEFVFPNRAGDGSANLKQTIASIFDAAGIKDARSHDVRRTFASAAAELEYSDATIGELIGHARRGVTSRHYIRRPDAALVAAATRVAQSIAAALNGDKDDNVVILGNAQL